MARPALSLRARLMILTFIPLTLISLLAGYWRISAAAETARDIFDRTLIALAVAISKDIANSGGEVLSGPTAELLQSTYSGRFYYHVYGPDGVFITGYATPPVKPATLEIAENIPQLFEADYRGERVRVAQMKERMTLDTLTGTSVVTVWQTLSARQDFTRQQAIRAIALIITLILTVAGVVWFGINLGLKPLTDLQQAIGMRSSDDLSTIKRPVPPEVSGIVATLNGLFGQVSAAIASRDRFISDAAHQLRNPVAGLLSLAEAAADAKSESDRQLRVREIVDAARHATRLTNQLLSLERAKGRPDRSGFRRHDLNQLVQEVCERNAKPVLLRGLDFSFDAAGAPAEISGEGLLIQEAVQNLIDNALKHAGPGNTSITVSVTTADGRAIINVADRGVGMAQEDSDLAFSRFSQLRPGEGSGLGLAIVDEIARLHGGEVRIEKAEIGARLSIAIPLST